MPTTAAETAAAEVEEREEVEVGMARTTVPVHQVPLHFPFEPLTPGTKLRKPKSVIK